MRWTQRRADERDGAYGEGVWSRSPDAGTKLVSDELAGDGGKKPGSPRRARHKT
jgi:hypothetical protein